MFFDYENENLSEIFKRENKEYYFDPIRRKLILITPEETVRQKWINFILNSLNVPEHLISVEEKLSHYGITSKLRADIIINGNDCNGAKYPLCIIECKATEVPISDKAFDQVFQYCDYIGAEFAIVSNGYNTYVYKYDENTDDYIRLDSIPTFKEMLNGEFIEYDWGVFPERTSLEKIKQIVENHQYDEYISLMTPKELALPAHNLLECLLDYRVCMPTGNYEVFTLLKDCGISNQSYGNHSGGVFYGPYRSFLIDFNGNTESVSFGISTYGSYSSDIEKTVINVAIDNDESSHHSLQLVIEDNIIVHEGVCDFYHHGKIGIGKIGSGKISDLRSIVDTVAPNLIRGNKFYFGSLPIDRLWTLQDEDVIELISNLICYALIRDSYRKYKKSQN